MIFDNDDNNKFDSNPNYTTNDYEYEVSAVINDVFCAGEWPRKHIESKCIEPWLGFKEKEDSLTPVQINSKDLCGNICLLNEHGYRFGKKDVLHNMLLQWINAEHGVFFIDPDGGVSKELMRRISEEQLEDVVWVQPKSKVDKNVGFNYFDTYREKDDALYEEEVTTIVEEFVSFYNLDRGKRIKSVSENVVEALIRSEETYSPKDFYCFLSGEHFVEEFDQYMEDLEEIERSDIEPILRRLEKVNHRSGISNISCDTDSSITVSEAVNTNKVVILDLSNNSDTTIQSAITNNILSQFKATIREREYMSEDEYDPYFLAIRELHKIGDSLLLDNLLSNSESLDLSITIQANVKNISFKDVLLQNVDNVYAFGRRASDEFITEVSDFFSNSPEELSEIFNDSPTFFYGEEGKSATFDIYPPVRSEKEAKKYIYESIHRYS